ncbi:MAG TPA: phosphonate ABC transporter, permease protein PhnE, partial [Roseomonas sp.]|nr:phosphonate ABC transporter, permease protein PhnE [Roseomonas sp.]
MSAAYGTGLPAVIRGEEAYQAARRQKRLQALLGGVLLFACLIAAARISEVDAATLWAGLPRIGEYFSRILPDLRWHALFANAETEGSIAFWFYRLPEWSLLILETANMAALATLMGSAAALLLAFPAARNIAPSPLAFHLARRTLEALRTVPEIVYALIFVWAFGVGPLAGILAIALHSAGANGKLFAEAIENADLKAWDGVASAGGSWLLGCRFAVLPQVLPNLISYLLLRFEVNIRSASVIGFVGAGGIGEEL